MRLPALVLVACVAKLVAVRRIILDTDVARDTKQDPCPANVIEDWKLSRKTGCIDGDTMDPVPSDCCRAEDCPPTAVRSKKGGCIDSATGNFVPEKCCSQEVPSMSCDLLQATFVRYLTIYTDQCGVKETDAKFEGSSAEVVDKTRLCSDKCLGNPRLAAAPPQLPDSWDQCENADPLRLMGTIVKALYSAQQTCKTSTVSEVEATLPAQEVASDVYATCPDKSMVSHECGHFGIDETGCLGKGCCWDPSQRPGRPWCYHKTDNLQCKRKCPISNFKPAWREDCGPYLMMKQFTDPDDNVRAQACESVGCCWQPLGHGSKEPWCFHMPCLA